VKKLTPKQTKFVAGIAKGKTSTQAVVDAGYKVKDRKVARSIGYENLTKPDIKEFIAPLLKKHDITLDTAIAPIGKALKATKVVIHGNKEDAFAEVVDDTELQLKGSDRALKLMGISNPDSPTTPINYKDITEALNANDEIRLQQVIFSKAKPATK
jgi:phage terminase small subunit